MGRAGGADGAAGGLALRHVATHVALEAVLALGGAVYFVLNVGGDSLDVTLVLALAEATAARIEDLLLRRHAVAVTVAVCGAVFVAVAVGFKRWRHSCRRCVRRSL